MRCGETHSRARELVAQGYQAPLVAMALAISRSSLYYRKRLRGSRADRRWDSEMMAACGAKPAYGYWRVAWWLRRKEGRVVNRKRVLRVMPACGRQAGAWSVGVFAASASPAAQGVGPGGNRATQAGVAD